MTESVVPPCPKGLLHKLSEPPRFHGTHGDRQEPGMVWEVVAPDGEVLLVLIVERFQDIQAGPFPIVRAIPLSDFVRLTDVGDAIVVVEPSGQILAAHCWLEGPILPEALVRSIGSASTASTEAVEKARAQSAAQSSNPAITSFRESLYLQFDPLFNSAWEKLYAHLDDVNRPEETEHPLALAMLAKWNQEITASVATVALAGSKGKVTSPTDAERFLRTWPIVGDPEVHANLELKPDQNGQTRLLVDLVGTAASTKKYTSVEVGFRTAPGRVASFQLGLATLPLASDQIEGIESLVVVAIDGIRRQVNLERPSNGT